MTGGLHGYEVFKIKTRLKGDPLPGGNVEKEDRECYPGSASFGITAWFFSCEKSAHFAFNRLMADLSVIPDDDSIPTVKTAESVKITPPDGVFTIKDLVKVYNEPRATIYRKVQELVKNGSVKVIGDKPSDRNQAKPEKMYHSVMDLVETA